MKNFLIRLFYAPVIFVLFVLIFCGIILSFEFYQSILKFKYENVNPHVFKLLDFVSLITWIGIMYWIICALIK
jgi:hypothetical protein